MITPADLDQMIHSPKRLAAMAILMSSTSTDFGFLREHLQLSDSDLSKQMTALSEAGYVQIKKNGRGRYSQTTYAITRTGREAYRAYREHLRTLLGE